MPDFTTLTRKQIKAIFARNRGAKAEVARRANVSASNVSKWLGGAYKSANVAEHAETHARELLVKEEADRIARGEANAISLFPAQDVSIRARQRETSRGDMDFLIGSALPPEVKASCSAAARIRVARGM